MLRGFRLPCLLAAVWWLAGAARAAAPLIAPTELKALADAGAVRIVDAVSYTHLTLPTSDLV